MKLYRITLLSLMVVTYVQCSNESYEQLVKEERKNLIESVNPKNQNSLYWRDPDAADAAVVAFIRKHNKKLSSFYEEKGTRLTSLFPVHNK